MIVKFTKITSIFFKIMIVGRKGIVRARLIFELSTNIFEGFESN